MPTARISIILNRNTRPDPRERTPDSFLRSIGRSFSRLIFWSFHFYRCDLAAFRVNLYLRNILRTWLRNVERPNQTPMFVLDFAAFDCSAGNLAERNFFCLTLRYFGFFH